MALTPAPGSQSQDVVPHTPPDRRRWAVLAVLCASLFLAGIDLTVLHVAVPTASRELLPSGTQLLWIVDIYPLTVAALLVTSGTLADRLGRRRMVLGGLVVFGLASAGAAAATTAVTLIVARGLLGVGAAMFMAATVAIIRQVFTDPRERGIAIGVWTAANSVGAAVGPALAGWLLERFWWGSVFVINVPVVVIALVAGWWVLPESRDPAPRRWDALSALVSIAGLFAVVYALKRAAEHLAVDTVGAVAAAGGLALLVGFVARQRLVRHPLLDIALFRDRRFAVATLCVLVGFGCYAALLYLVSQLVQLVNGASPLQAGLALMPLAVANATGAVLAPWLQRGLGYRWTLAAALGGFAAGVAGMAVSAGGASPLVLTLWLGLAGLGSGAVMTVGADAILSAAHPDRAGEAGAIQETSFELGSGLGVAALGAVLAATYRAALPVFPELPAGVEAQLHESLGAATALAGPAATEVLPAARDAFTHGFAAAGAVAAGALAATAVLCVAFLGPGSGRH